MVTALIHHRVADFDAWKAEYDRVAASPLAAAVKSYRIWRDQDDPNLVILAETFESRAVAEGIFGDPAMPEILAAAGVETSSMRVHYVDEVDSWSR